MRKTWHKWLADFWGVKYRKEIADDEKPDEGGFYDWHYTGRYVTDICTYRTAVLMGIVKILVFSTLPAFLGFLVFGMIVFEIIPRLTPTLFAEWFFGILFVGVIVAGQIAHWSDDDIQEAKFKKYIEKKRNKKQGPTVRDMYRSWRDKYCYEMEYDRD